MARFCTVRPTRPPIQSQPMFSKLVEKSPWPNKSATRTAIGPFAGSADARCIAELAGEDRLLLVITADHNS